MLKMTRPLALLVAAAWLSPGGAPAQTNTQPGDAIVAKAKGLEIRRSELDKQVSAALAQLASKGRPTKAGHTEEAERQILDQLINVRLVVATATAADKAAGKAAAEKRFAASRAKLGSEEALEAQLKQMELTRQELLAKWTEALTAEAVLKREFKINITDQEIRSFYDEHPNQFEVPETVRASHILLATIDLKTSAPLTDEEKAAKHKTAEALLKRARAGEDFAKLAKEYSEDPVSKARGGEYTFAHGQMAPEVEAAAFAMSTNQIGDIVTSSYGYHIIKVSEKIPTHKIAFANAASDIKNVLTQHAIEEQFPDYIAELRKAAGVEILDKRLEPKEPGVVPIPAPNTSTRKPG